MHNGLCFLQMQALQKNHGRKKHLDILKPFTPLGLMLQRNNTQRARECGIDQQRDGNYHRCE